MGSQQYVIRKAISLPARLLGSGYEAVQTKFPETDTTDFELAVNRPRPSTQVAAPLNTTAELWLPL